MTGRRFVGCTALAAVAYLLVALWAYRSVLGQPSVSLVTSVAEGPMAAVCRWDQSAAVATIARHAHVLLTEPWTLLDGYQCYPLARSHTLGEHMFGAGLLATVPWLLTGDPILTYNAVLVLSVWIAGLAMYAFAYDYLRDPAAAFVAGLLFALAMARIFDAAHPFAYADQWTPLAMLFLHRLFAEEGGARNALAFALFASLIVLQSVYPLVAGTILLAFYAVHLAWAYRDRLVARLPALALALALLAVACWVVLAPYLETRAVWNLLSGRASLPVPVSSWRLLTSGSVLALVAVVDRLRGPRPRGASDPRWCFFLATLLLLWTASLAIPIPGTGLLLPSPMHLLRAIMPGADAVRGLNSIGSFADLPIAFLAGWGVHAILARASRPVAVAAAAALALFVVAERLHPPLATRVFGGDPSLKRWSARPEAEDLALLRRTSGPVLDLPHGRAATVKAFEQADHLRLASFDARASSSCYASYPSPIDRSLNALAAALPDAAAADALHALGFRTVLLHVPSYWKPDLTRFERSVGNDPQSRARLVEVGRTPRLIAYALESPAAATSDLAALSAAAPEALLQLSPSDAKVALPVRNATERTFVHAEPIAPSDVVVAWRDAAGAVVAEQPARVLLPIALGSGATQEIELPVQPPAAPGRYALTVAPLAQPSLVVARAVVDVHGG